jgi:chitinase
VTVHYATVNGSATAGADFQTGGATLTFAPGVTSQTVSVPVFGDRLAENTETFSVVLSDATGAGIYDDQGIGTIVDNEPRLSINNVSKKEGNGKSTNFVFTVSLSSAYDQSVTVSFSTAAGTATAGSDYETKSGTVTFAPGETVKTITVAVKGDKAREANETFFVNLSDASSTAFINVSKGVGTILNDDNRF